MFEHMKIYLIRHGQTTGDIEDRFGGDYDDHLTRLGKSQSQNLAKKKPGGKSIFASRRLVSDFKDFLSHCNGIGASGDFAGSVGEFCNVNPRVIGIFADLVQFDDDI